MQIPSKAETYRHHSFKGAQGQLGIGHTRGRDSKRYHVKFPAHWKMPSKEGSHQWQRCRGMPVNCRWSQELRPWKCIIKNRYYPWSPQPLLTFLCGFN